MNLIHNLRMNELVEKNILEMSKKLHTEEIQLYLSILEPNKAAVLNDKPDEEGFVEYLDQVEISESVRISCKGVLDDLSISLKRLDLTFDKDTNPEHQHGLISNCTKLIEELKKNLAT